MRNEERDKVCSSPLGRVLARDAFKGRVDGGKRVGVVTSFLVGVTVRLDCHATLWLAMTSGWEVCVERCVCVRAMLARRRTVPLDCRAACASRNDNSYSATFLFESRLRIGGDCPEKEKGPPGERATLFRKTCKT